jgi:hypothetical protein
MTTTWDCAIAGLELRIVRLGMHTRKDPKDCGLRDCELGTPTDEKSEELRIARLGTARFPSPLATAVEHLFPRHLVEAMVPEIMDRVLDPSARGLDLGVGGQRPEARASEVRNQKTMGALVMARVWRSGVTSEVTTGGIVNCGLRDCASGDLELRECELRIARLRDVEPGTLNVERAVGIARIRDVER